MSHPNQRAPVVRPAWSAGRRGRPTYDVADAGAAFTSNNELHGHELPPALNRMYCRDCGTEVKGSVKCPHCGGAK